MYSQSQLANDKKIKMVAFEKNFSAYFSTNQNRFSEHLVFKIWSIGTISFYLEFNLITNLLLLVGGVILILNSK